MEKILYFDQEQMLKWLDTPHIQVLDMPIPMAQF